MAFATEKEMEKTVLSSRYINDLINLNGGYYEVEPKGLFGIPDIVVGNLVYKYKDVENVLTYAFELKLYNWRRAIIQAYKYRSFAHYSFVMIDSDHISAPLKNINTFIKSNIGLLSIDNDGKIKIHYEPSFDHPYSEQLSKALRDRMFDKLKMTNQGKSTYTYKN